MKKVLDYLKKAGIHADPQEIKRAYWREIKQNRACEDTPRKVLEYLVLNCLTKNKNETT